MANTSNVLSAKLEVRDSFTSQLNKFKNALNNTETAYNKFATRLEKTSEKIEKSLDAISKKMDQTSKKIISKTEEVSTSIIKSSDKVEQKQKKAMDDLLTKYMKMGGDIQNVFKNIQKEADTLNKSGLKVNINSKSSSSNMSNSHNMNNDMFGVNHPDYALNSLLSGDFQMMLMQLGVIGGAVLGANKILTTLDGWAQQGFNTLNTISTGLLSVDGLTRNIQEAGQFETNRVAMDVLYGNDKVKGQEYYQMGTKLAKNTPYSEIELGNLQKKLAGASIEYKEADLMTLLDVASIKPELGADHVGFSVVDAMGGRSTSLKTNYMLDNKEIQKYLKELGKSSNTTDRANAKKWKDAFTKTGTVGNKQEYFELLISYVRNQTEYNGLTNTYSKTMNGLIDRLKGNWETLRADLLGLDANNTGMVKPDKITVFSSIQKGIDNFDKWLDSDNAKRMLDDLGEGLGTAVNSITDAFIYLLKNVQWKEVGEVFKKIGDTVEDIIQRLTKNGTLDKLLDVLPALAEIAINNEVIKAETEFKYKSSFATGDVGGGVTNWVTGKQLQVANFMGDEDANWNTVEDLSKNKSWLNQWWDKLWEKDDTNTDNIMLSDINASAVLAKSDLSDYQKQTIQDMIKKDDTVTYGDIYIGSINANSFTEIMESLKKYQANKK